MMAYMLLMAPCLMLFQVHLPVGHSLLNVNLADPLAALGVIAFGYQSLSDRPSFRFRGILLFTLLATGAMTVALLIGYLDHGWTSWALINKYAGWYVLLAFGASGLFLGLKHFDEAINVFIYTFCAIGLYAIIQQSAVNLGLTEPVQMKGFAGNTTAFAFQSLMALCAIIVRGNTRTLPLAIIPVACCILSGSRAAAGTIAIVLALACIYIQGKWLKTVAVTIVGVALIGGVYLLSRASSLIGRSTTGLYDFQLGLPFSASYALSNSEHYQTISQSFAMFFESSSFWSRVGYIQRPLVRQRDR